MPQRITVELYHRLIAAGVLTEGHRVELLEGCLVERTRQTPRRAVAIGLVPDALRERTPAGWRARRPSAVTTADSEPEPDVVVVRGEARTYDTRHPESDDVGLIVEVSDEFTRDLNRGPKARVYARAAITVYWNVDLVDGRVEVYTSPEGEYRRRDDFGPEDAVPLILPSHPTRLIPVADLLPNRPSRNTA